VPYSDLIFENRITPSGSEHDPISSGAGMSRSEVDEDSTPSNEPHVALFADLNSSLYICGLSSVEVPRSSTSAALARLFSVGSAFVQITNSLQLTQLYKIVVPNPTIARLLANGNAELVKTTFNGLLTTQVRETGRKAIATANLVASATAANFALSLLSSALSLGAMMALSYQISSLSSAINDILQRQISQHLTSISSEMKSAFDLSEDVAYQLRCASTQPATTLTTSQCVAIESKLSLIWKIVYQVLAVCEYSVEQEKARLAHTRGAEEASLKLDLIESYVCMVVCAVKLRIFTCNLEMQKGSFQSEPVQLRRAIQALQTSMKTIESIQTSFDTCREKSNSGFWGDTEAWMRSDRAKFPKVEAKCRDLIQLYTKDLERTKRLASRMMLAWPDEDNQYHNYELDESDFEHVYAQLQRADNNSDPSYPQDSTVASAPQMVPVHVHILGFDPNPMSRSSKL
jgi:hypothetical protein